MKYLYISGIEYQGTNTDGNELFFKKLKQKFSLLYFAGDNQNALIIQICYVLIALLLLYIIHSHNVEIS